MTDLAPSGDGSEQALARQRSASRVEHYRAYRVPPAEAAALNAERNHTTHDLARVAELMLGVNTLEGRVVRAEVAASAAVARVHYLECQVDSVRMGLRLERVPRQADAGGPLTLLGRIRWLGDKCRRAEQRTARLERELKRLRAEFRVSA